MIFHRSTEHDSQPSVLLAAGRAWETAPERPTLIVIADEAAVAVHPLVAIKTALTLLGGLMASLILPAASCGVWVAIALLLEFWCWFATRRQARGEPIDWRVRAGFIAYYLVANFWWLLMGLLLWRTGTVAGEATGAIVVVAISFIFVLLFYNTPLTFLAAGAAPAVAALTVIVLEDGRGASQFLPVWIALVLGLIFNLGRALDTPSAQEAQRRLNDSLNKYKILADNVTDVIVRTDLDGVHQYVSPASLKVLGYRPDELVGARRHDFIHPDDLASLDQAFARMLASPSRAEVITARVRHKDGHWLWLQTSAQLVCEDETPVAIIDVSRDVTERIAADIALREATEQAECASRAKAEFLANVSHEIRTPMNGILGALHLLEREAISTEGREIMRQANDCGRMLSQLLNDVLDFSKIEAGQLELAPEPMDMREALASVTALLASQARANGVELRTEIVGGDLWIQADPMRLRQAMFNLVGNAVKFTRDGHVLLRLRIEALADERRHVRLEVEDTGIGMTPQTQAGLFERFRQAEGGAARRFGGTGLGLSITRSLVSLMGGEIAFTSVEGEGSTFSLDFVAPGAAQTTGDAPEEELLHDVHILLVEDNPTNRLVARTMLGRLGARVDEAEDGLAGVEAARLGIHDLILMDIQMPHMDGVAATRAIRALDGAAAQVPIIALTANVMVQQREEYMAAGMNGIVAKPISPAALLAEIASVTAPDDEVRYVG